MILIKNQSIYSGDKLIGQFELNGNFFLAWITQTEILELAEEIKAGRITPLTDIKTILGEIIEENEVLDKIKESWDDGYNAGKEEAGTYDNGYNEGYDDGYEEASKESD